MDRDPTTKVLGWLRPVVLGAALMMPAALPAAAAPERQPGQPIQQQAPFPLLDRQATNEHAQYLADRVQHDITGVFPGEDTLGSGTAFTH